VSRTKLVYKLNICWPEHLHVKIGFELRFTSYCDCVVFIKLLPYIFRIKLATPSLYWNLFLTLLFEFKSWDRNQNTMYRIIFLLKMIIKKIINKTNYHIIYFKGIIFRLAQPQLRFHFVKKESLLVKHFILCQQR